MLAKTAKPTGKEQNIRKINQLEQKRKKENLEDKIEGPRKAALVAIATQLDAVYEYVQGCYRETQLNRAETLKAMRKAAIESKMKVDHLKSQIHDAIKQIDHLPKEIRSRRKEAAREGRKDYLIELHFRRTGLASFRRQVAGSESQLHTLRREFADLMYTIDWTAWNIKREKFMLEEVIKDTAKLKLEGGFHRLINHQLHEFKRAMDKIESIMLALSDNLAATCSSLARSEARRYLKISTTIPRELGDARTLVVTGHRWRKYDRYALVESHFPALNRYVSVEIIPARLSDEMLDEAAAGYRLLRRARYKGFWPLARQGRRAAYQTMSDMTLRHLTKGHALSLELQSFCREGLFLLNPALRSDPGRLTYAALYPFKVYNIATTQTENFYRKVYEDTKEALAMVKLILFQRSGKDPETAKEFRLMKDRLERTSNIVELAEKQAKQFVRPFLQDLNAFSARITARILEDDGNDLNLKRILSEMNDRAKHQFNEEQEIRDSELQLNDLSSPVLYRNDMTANRLMDPLKLRGNATLYHSGDIYPVEFLSVKARVVQVLNNIVPGQIVGLDILGCGSGEKGEYPAFVSIATTEEVFVIDWTNYNESWDALTEFLENPEIIKVTYDANQFPRRLSSYNGFLPSIHPRGLVSIGERTINRNLKPVDRLTSAGPWKPIEHWDIGRGSLIKSFADLAFLSTYNLWTFLSAGTPDQLVPLTSHNRTKILQTRERLQHKIRAAGERGLELGLVNWDHQGVFANLKKCLGIDRRSRNSLQRFAGVEAQKFLGMKRREGLEVDIDPIGHAAYYMFTTFKEDLPTIGALFGKPSWSIAQRVLEVTKALELTLYSEDLKRLQSEAETEPEKLSAEGVTPVVQPDEDPKNRAQKIRERRDKEKRTAEEQRKAEEKRKTEERQKAVEEQEPDASIEHKEKMPSVSKSGTTTIGAMFEKGQSFISSFFTKTSEAVATTNETTAQGNAEYSPFQPSKPSPLKKDETKKPSETERAKGGRTVLNSGKGKRKDTGGPRQKKGNQRPKKLPIRSVSSLRVRKKIDPLARHVSSDKQQPPPITKVAAGQKDLNISRIETVSKRKIRHYARRIKPTVDPSKLRPRRVADSTKPSVARAKLNDPLYFAKHEDNGQ